MYFGTLWNAVFACTFLGQLKETQEQLFCLCCKVLISQTFAVVCSVPWCPFLKSPEKLFYVCCVCIQEQDFSNYENDTKKLGKTDRFVSQKLCCAVLETVPVLSRNGPLARGLTCFVINLPIFHMQNDEVQGLVRITRFAHEGEGLQYKATISLASIQRTGH